MPEPRNSKELLSYMLGSSQLKDDIQKAFMDADRLVKDRYQAAFQKAIMNDNLDLGGLSHPDIKKALLKFYGQLSLDKLGRFIQPKT